MPTERCVSGAAPVGAAPDRYGDAVRSRRAELRAESGALSGTHRAELRSELTMARIVAADAVTTEFAALVRQAGAYTAHPGTAVRRRMLAALPAALDAAAERVHAAVLAALVPAVRRIAAARGLDLGLDLRWPALVPPRLPVLDEPPEQVRAPRLAGAAEGLAVWRVALVVLAAMPLIGLPVLGGPALAPVAVGLGAAAVAVAVRLRRSGIGRAVLQRQVDAVLTRGQVVIRGDTERMLVALERVVAVELDAAVERRRAAVATELSALAASRAVARA